MAAAAFMFAGCYGSKMVRGPINSEHAAAQADSIRADQQRLMRQIAELQQRLDDEREARLRSQAQTSVTLQELDESVRILISRIDDNAQRSSGGGVAPRRAAPPPAVIAQDTSAADSTTPPGLTGETAADNLYRAAYLDLTRGDYALAIQGFQNYLGRFPNGANLAEVQYYLGESYYATERYVEAVSAFNYVVREFTGSRLVPAAYLKSGQCYGFLDEKSLAAKAFNTLIDQHPNTEEAQQARTALAELEG